MIFLFILVSIIISPREYVKSSSSYSCLVKCTDLKFNSILINMMIYQLSDPIPSPISVVVISMALTIVIYIGYRSNIIDRYLIRYTIVYRYIL